MKILDCTLRDGGYYNKWDFEDDVVISYIQSIKNLPIEYIEIGYRSVQKNEYFGKYFYLPTSVIEKIKELAGNTKLSIMLNEKDTDLIALEKLLDNFHQHISLIRIAIDPENFDRALILGKTIKERGYEIAFNFMYISKYCNNNEFFNKLSKLNGLVKYIYLVDSYGCMMPTEVKNIVLNVRKNCTSEVGFHGHNNMELAFANSLAAIEGGCEIIDSTILGMGRGAGNLKTELLLTYLASKNQIKVDFNSLSEITELWTELWKKHQWGTNLPYIFSGATSMPQKDVMEWVGKRFYSYNTIIRAINNQSIGIKDNIELKKFKYKLKSDKVLIIGGGKSVVAHQDAINEYLNKNKDIIVIHVSSKNVKSFEFISNKQIHCLIGNEGKRLETIFTNITNSDRIAVLPPFPRKMGSYIPLVFTDNSYQLNSISFIDGYEESATALAIQIAITLSAKQMLFAGYDGYSDNVSENEMELFNENQFLFSKLIQMQIKAYSITSTKYNIPELSIYSIL